MLALREQMPLPGRAMHSSHELTNQMHSAITTHCQLSVSLGL
jgi:hypothetical protein